MRFLFDFLVNFVAFFFPSSRLNCSFYHFCLLSILYGNKLSLIEFTDINDCVNHTCQNGGSCVDGINNFTCNCLKGYTGSHCQTGMLLWRNFSLNTNLTIRIIKTTWFALLKDHVPFTLYIYIFGRHWQLR